MFNPSDLIGTKVNPQGFSVLRDMSRAAKAYHNLNPYPLYSPMTKDWKTEQRGPYPRCLPFVQTVITKGSRWLFGKPVSFKASDSDEVSDHINNIWTGNQMGSRAVAMATLGAQCGGVALKWTYDEESDPQVRIHVLDASEHTRFYYDPMDKGKLLMARIQYPFFDSRNGKVWWYREDVTDEEFVHYKPVEAQMVYASQVNDDNSMAQKLDIFENWTVESREPNPFGVINVWYVKNKEVNRELGEGDLWSTFHIVDQINFTYDLAFKHNQKSIDPQKTFIDLQPETDEAPGDDSPGGIDVLQTAEGAQSQGKIDVFQPSAEMRGPIREYAQDLIDMLYDQVGSVRVRESEITNKGNLTSAVLTQLYAALIETTEEKRKLYGEDGICKFFERMSVGLFNLQAPGWAAVNDVEIHWPEYFEKTEEEQYAGSQKRAFQVKNGLKTREHAIREQASSDNVINQEQYISEVKAEYDDQQDEQNDFPDPSGDISNDGEQINDNKIKDKKRRLAG